MHLLLDILWNKLVFVGSCVNRITIFSIIFEEIICEKHILSFSQLIGNLILENTIYEKEIASN